ncbi:MAG: cyclic nucleotide-binding domain-containing protein [Deltaproteobacteria bacterium]|nr:cyclic nucleotide-binding domain-containing protein [Deltaproteobacteria bacterium]
MIKIGKIGLFCGMSAAEEEKIISLAEQVAFNKGNVVIHEGDIGDALFVVRSGSVVVSKDVGNGLSEVLTSFESGEFFGEMALIDRSKRSATVTALETLQLLKFSGGRLDEFAVKEPEIFAKLYRNFATTLASHLRRSTEKLRLLAKESHDLKSTVFCCVA